MIVNLNESKDGHFLVQDRLRHVVGAVNMHAQSTKNLDVHKRLNGDQAIRSAETGFAELNLRQDLRNAPNSRQPRRRVQMHLTQNHDTQADVQVLTIRSQPQYAARPMPVPAITQQPQVYRFRRQVNVADQPCSETGCLDALLA